MTSGRVYWSPGRRRRRVSGIHPGLGFSVCRRDVRAWGLAWRSPRSNRADGLRSPAGRQGRILLLFQIPARGINVMATFHLSIVIDSAIPSLSSSVINPACLYSSSSAHIRRTSPQSVGVRSIRQSVDRWRFRSSQLHSYIAMWKAHYPLDQT